MSVFVSAVFAVLLAFAGSAVLAQTTPAPGDVTMSSVVESYENRGFIVREVDREDGLFEVEATGPDGVRVDAVIDIATGTLLREHRLD